MHHSRDTAPVPPILWHIHAEDGQNFGPVSREQLDAWFAEGRITAGCFVWQDGDKQMRHATDVYPQLGSSQTVVCPYCSEQILATATKCKHCGEFLNKKPRKIKHSSESQGPICRRCNVLLIAREKPVTVSMGGILGFLLFLGGLGTLFVNAILGAIMMMLGVLMSVALRPTQVVMMCPICKAED
ncbi:MAG: DUF4339 domain-containing protein [Planctomycetes bacterium]|nr:DUF4339 domain-containing protein [Planctomycetota bacterium]